MFKGYWTTGTGIRPTGITYRLFAFYISLLFVVHLVNAVHLFAFCYLRIVDCEVLINFK